MTPEQLQDLARLVAAQVSVPPWWSYLLLVLFSMVSAAIGAGIGAFLKKWGENLANTVAFNRLRAELIANTQAAEGVKAALSGRSWLKQQLWVQREKHYMQLLSQLANTQRLSVEMRDLIDASGLQVPEEASRKMDEKISRTLSELQAAEMGLKQAMAPAAGFLSQATYDEVARLFGKKQAADRNAADRADGYHEWVGITAEAYTKVLGEARRELQDAFKDDAASTP